jgi:putative ABC transport system permease protein
MRPLSTANYFLRNKRKLLSNIVVIIAAICLVYIMECFIYSIVQSIYPLDATRFEHASIIITTERTPEILQEVLSSLDESENIESVIPVTVRQIVFSVPGSTTHAAVFAAAPDDLPYLIDTFQIEVVDGRLPESGTDEISVDSNWAKNNGLLIGSQTGIDVSHNLNRQYTVVGILDSKSHISLVGSPSPADSLLKYDEKGYLVFHAADRSRQAENEVAAYSSHGLNVWTLARYEKLYAANNQTFQILDMVAVLSIIVMVVCLVCSKYAQFFSRKSEVGILSALGYTHREITMRTFHEVIATNLLGFIIGLSLAVFLCKIVVSAAFGSIGGTGVYLYGKAALLSLLAPVLTTVFTLFPVNRLIKKVDAISIVTSN